MNTTVVNEVVVAMSRYLNCTQLKTLKNVLLEKTKTQPCSAEQSSSNNERLEEFLSAKDVEGCSQRTLDYYRATLEKLLTSISKELPQISTDDLRRYLSAYQKQNNSSKVTIDNIRRIMSSFFAWLEDEDYIVKSPVRRIHKVKTPTLVKEIITDEELETLRDGCTTKRDLAIVDLLTSTGMRIGELVQLNRADINFQERECIVLGKGNKERRTYFDARTKLHLQQYLAQRTDQNEALFVTLTSNHARISIGAIELRLRNLGKRLKCNRIHPHKFRRTLATNAIDKGMPIEQVQKLLGHIRIDTTMQYALVNQNNVKHSHRKYLG